MKKVGFTLLELIIVLGMTVVLVGGVMFVYMVSFNAWNSGQDRTSLRIELSQAIEAMSKDLRQASSVTLTNVNDVKYTVAGVDYRYCLYSATGAPYGLVKGSGSVPCAAGPIMASGLSTSVFTYVGNVLTIDLSAVRNASSVHLRTNVWPRNLPP
ncbi:MAG: hypothetical protein HQL17_03760 [Candidatus Omnitrophica bacterium]|nr:hypothetical protein [Candidatus Omnitrophota bacterium]